MLKQINDPFLDMSEEELELFDQISIRSDFYNYETSYPNFKVIGVGGAGSNMLDYLIDNKTFDINRQDIIIANTDAMSLDLSFVPYKIQLGMNITKGLGSGMLPDRGRDAAIESLEEVKEMLAGSDIVIIASGMGGGTGTGASPIIAKAAKSIGAIVVSVVTTPFKFEGQKRTKLAIEGLSKLKQESDSLIIIPNEQLLHIIEKNLGIKESFKFVDDVVAQLVRGFSNILFSQSKRDINVDFSDVTTVLKHKGIAIIGTGYSCGNQAAYDSAKMAIESPLLDNISIDGAKGVLVQFDIHPDYPLSSISEAMDIIYDSADEDADVIFGTTTSEDMELDEVCITIVATGFEEEKNIYINDSNKEKLLVTEPLKSSNTRTVSLYEERRKVVGGYDEDNEDILEVPTFLRKQMD